MPVIQIEGAKVDYDIREGGPFSVIFLHGGFGSSSQLWSRTMSALPDQFTAYAINNFIRSDAPPTGYNVQSFAHRVGVFIKTLNLQKPVLVGHSMGGVVCQLAALEFQSLIGGLVLVCTGASMRNHDLGRRLLEQMKRSNADSAEDTIRSVSSNWFHRAPPDGFFDEYVARAKTVPWKAIIDVQESLIATDLEDKLADIKLPTLVVHGPFDTGRTRGHADTLYRGIPQSELVVMEGSGHSPMLETPQQFNSKFLQFLVGRVWSSRAEVSKGDISSIHD